MIDTAALEAALDRIRPYLHREGGDIQVVRVGERCAWLRLVGRIPDDLDAVAGIRLRLEAFLRERVPGLERVDLA
jgi:Fe-S cluster biogenesis protein NfuA